MPDYIAAADSLEAIYLRYYPLLLQRAAADVAADLGRAVALDPDAAGQVTAQIAARVQGVLDTQRDRIAALINTYDGNPDGLRAALQAALDTTDARAQMIMTTEVTHAYNSGVALAAQSAGARVHVQDGDGDPDCAAVDGTVQTAAWLLANPSGHPNCQRRGFAVE